MNERPLAVVGAGAAGLTAVEALRRGGYSGPITLIGDEPHLPYDRPPLSKEFLLGSVTRERLNLREPEALDRLGVDLRLGRTAQRVDVGARRLFLDDESIVPYGRLVVATGVRPTLPESLGHSRGVFQLRTVDDAERLGAALARVSSLVVVGGGLLGYELAALARTAGLSVTLLDRRARALDGVLGPVAGPLVAELHRSRGVDVRSGCQVREVSSTGRETAAEIVLGDGSTFSAELVVAAVGSRPNVEWLAGNGLDLSDGIACDQVGRGAPGVYAIGDVARWRASTDHGTRTEHRTNATEQALAVAQHITHGRRPFAPVPYFWTDQFGERIQVAGSIPVDAETRLVAGDPASRRFVITASRHGTACGVLGWRMPKDFARERAALSAQGGPT